MRLKQYRKYRRQGADPKPSLQSTYFVGKAIGSDNHVVVVVESSLPRSRPVKRLVRSTTEPLTAGEARTVNIIVRHSAGNTSRYCFEKSVQHSVVKPVRLLRFFRKLPPSIGEEDVKVFVQGREPGLQELDPEEAREIVNRMLRPTTARERRLVWRPEGAPGLRGGLKIEPFDPIPDPPPPPPPRRK